MTKQLFKPAPSKEQNHNATIGGKHASRNVYVHSYFQAATILANIALKNNPNEAWIYPALSKDPLFYPILFNYRHYIELHLKSLIIDTEQLYTGMEDLGYTKGELKLCISKHLDSTHSIERLFNSLAERLRLVSEDEISQSVRKTIMQLHCVDPDGQGFRYHERTGRNPSFPYVQHYDLQNIRDSMNEVHDQLTGVEIFLDIRHEETKTLLSSMNTN